MKRVDIYDVPEYVDCLPDFEKKNNTASSYTCLTMTPGL